jgi:hypothetical protein
VRQDKDRSSKWLIERHGDALLKLGGLTGFTSWRPLPPETIAPRRLPDGLIEVRFPGDAEPRLVLVEIETDADRRIDPQVLEDLMLLAVERRAIPGRGAGAVPRPNSGRARSARAGDVDRGDDASWWVVAPGSAAHGPVRRSGSDD